MPDTINHYLYCYNNPTVFVDDNGLWPSLADIGNGIKTAYNKAETWCEDHKEIVQTAVAIGTLTLAVGVTVATFGTGAGALVLAAGVAGTVVGGIEAASNHTSITTGMARGLTNTSMAITSVVMNPVGAATGFVMQAGSDIMNGKASSIESYTAAMASGALMMQTGSAAMGGVSYPAVRNNLENLFGVSKHSGEDTYVEMSEGYFHGTLFDMNFGYHPYTRAEQMCAEDASATGIPKSAKDYVNSSDNNINAKVNTVQLENGTWSKGAVARGDAIDKALDNNVGHNYPVIDRMDADGVVTSVKSRDLTSSTYQNASRLEYQIKKDVDALDAFSGKKWNGIESCGHQISYSGISFE